MYIYSVTIFFHLFNTADIHIQQYRNNDTKESIKQIMASILKSPQGSFLNKAT